MATLLMRHALPEWPLVNERHWPGLANDLVPLSEQGRVQATEAAESLADAGITALVSSPMTRALETAAVVSRRLGLPIQVHLDLREWLPDDTYQWRTLEEILVAYRELLAGEGEWPPGQQRTWEPLSRVRARARAALDATAADADVRLVVCHEVVIHALTGFPSTPHATVRRLDPWP